MRRHSFSLRISPLDLLADALEKAYPGLYIGGVDCVSESTLVSSLGTTVVEVLTAFKHATIGQLIPDFGDVGTEMVDSWYMDVRWRKA